MKAHATHRLSNSASTSHPIVNRARMPRLRAVLIVVSCVLALVGCADGNGIRDVTLAELADNSQRWDGHEVRVRGTVRGYDDPRHYWLEDAFINRVGLQPPQAIAAHLGREITVVGHYTYARDRGRQITISTIEAFDNPR